MKGLDRFREHFAGFENQYVLIGGAACDIVMTDAGLDYRLTKDLDIVLCVEALETAFLERLGAFLEAGGYAARERSGGRKEFYRFHKPSDAAFPAMIEIFSRRPDGVELPGEALYTPLPLADEVLSLSALLLDENYYNLLLAMRRVVDGVSVLDETALIPFKARAHIDLRARRDAGEKIDKDDIRKHRADVFRLLQLLPADASIALPQAIAADLSQFATIVSGDEDFVPVGGVTLATAIARLHAAYGLSPSG